MPTRDHPPEPEKPKTASQNTSANLRAIMAAKNIENGDMATALGISYNSVVRRRLGHHNFKLNELPALAAFLDVSVETLTAPAEALATGGTP